MKTKTQFKQEMRKYFREVVDKAVGETFGSWFDNLWASLEADGQVIKISGTNYVRDDSDSKPQSSEDANAVQKLKATVKDAIIKGQECAWVVDLRDYKEAAQKAVAEENGTGDGRNWSVKSVNKFRVKVAWDGAEAEKATFSIRVESGWVENPVVIGELADGRKTVAFVGDASWDDYGTYEEAIAGVIHSMAQIARNT